MPNPLVGLTRVDDSDITDSAVPGTAITTSQPINILFAQDTLERKVEGKWRDLLGKVLL